jgi:hypothetical protein
MARSLEQITKDLESLEATTSRTDQELKSLYREYLSVLSSAVSRQLVIAAYHLCTQAYPEKFLNLSVSQREKVQVGIRTVASRGSRQIEQLGLATSVECSPSDSLNTTFSDEDSLDTESLNLESLDPESLEEGIGEETTADFQSSRDQEPAADTSTPRSDRNQNSDSDLPVTLEETPSASADGETETSEEASELVRRLMASLSLFSVFAKEPLSPVTLAKRHVLLERHLRTILQTLSSLANHLLKQAYILPDLPEVVIAAAAETDSSESGPSTPNLLNVLVEIDDNSDSQDDSEEEDPEEESELFEDGSDREVTHLIAINLQLADIEFADSHTALWRGKLQEALVKLKRLGTRYQKLQQEKARADAEHAWRAIWYED